MPASSLHVLATPSHARRTALVASLALGLASGAFAERSPLYFGAGLSAGHDSNVFRAPEGSPQDQSDSYTSAFVLAGIDKPFGRQRFFADATVRRTEFRDLDALSNTGYDLNAGVDWSALDRLSGTLRYGMARARSQQNLDAAVVTERNLETAREFLARAQYGGEAILAIETEYVHRSIDYSASAFTAQENSSDSVRAGLLYRVSGALRLGAGVRYTEGKYPQGVQVSPGVFDEDKYKRRDLDLTARWSPTGASTLNARVSFGKQENDAQTSRDFSGTTGSIRWEWQPTGKLRFDTRLSRDTGFESSFLSFGTNNGQAVGDTSRLTTALQIGAIWDITSKIALDADGRYARRSLVNTGGINVDESDRTHLFGLGITYKPTRIAELSCKVSREERNTSGTILTYPYSATVAMCGAQIVLR
ncbi:hypothetical protein [Methylibium petroleiphilum]|uniref:hypothetical protein n=1 Tax=Methylibium petroleiphilum TaxID=105560 RepID=UPI001AD1008A|nr:hypothetical protein [Methylibium petroleiphilum]MBN9203449.1 hypothetical protein [Methylibium petroleiphilum]